MTVFWRNTTRLEVVFGDITEQNDVDAIVNAANAFLMPARGVSGAIHAVAGPALLQECRQHVPLRPGQAVITDGYGLPNDWVIHCLGPVYGSDNPSAALLAECYCNALKIASSRGVHSIAFPAISVGQFGYPVHAAARVAVDAVCEFAVQQETVGLVRFVLQDEFAFRVFYQTLENTLGAKAGRSLNDFRKHKQN